MQSVSDGFEPNDAVFVRRAYRADVHKLRTLVRRRFSPSARSTVEIVDRRLPSSMTRYFDDRASYFAVLQGLAEALIFMERFFACGVTLHELLVSPARLSVKSGSLDLVLRGGRADEVHLRVQEEARSLEVTLTDRGGRGVFEDGGTRRAIKLPADEVPERDRFARAVELLSSEVVKRALWEAARREAERALNEVDMELAPPSHWGDVPNPLALGWVRRWPPLLRMENEHFHQRIAQMRLDGARVLLVRTPNRDRASRLRLLPFSTPALAGFLERQGVRVSQLDLNAIEEPAGGWDEVALRRMLTDRHGVRPSFDLVGFSVDRPEDHPEALAIAQRTRALVDGVFVFGGRGVGGGAFSDFEVAPYAINGDGELALLLLLAHLTLRSPGLDAIPGLAYRGEDGRVRNNVATEHALATLPRPSYGELLADYRRTFSAETLWVPYSWEMGCAFSCAYCSNYTEARVRFRGGDDVLEDLTRIRDELGLTQVAFFNNMLNMRPKLAVSLYDAFVERKMNLRWGDSARPSRFDARLFPRLARSGCHYLVWGVDAGSDRLQRLMRKKLRFDEVQSILRGAHEHGIENKINIIVGLPHETEEDLAELLSLLERLRPYTSAVYLSQYVYSESSPVYRWPSRYGLMKRGNSFDEIGGLRWEDKQRQIATHHEIVVEKLRELGLR